LANSLLADFHAIYGLIIAAVGFTIKYSGKALKAKAFLL
jgi:hypothetical protein